MDIKPAILLIEDYQKYQYDWRLKQALKLLRELDQIEKQAGILDFLTSPMIQNIINFLSPFINDYRISQAIKLIQEYLTSLVVKK